MRRIRKEAGVKQVTLAREISISPQALRALESGQSVPKQATLERFCKFMEVPKCLLILQSIESSDLKDRLATEDAADVLDIIGLAQQRIRRSLDRYNGYIDEV